MSSEKQRSIIHVDAAELPEVNGTIMLQGSKSISNRVLIIRALSQSLFDIHLLSSSDDTVILNKLLSSKDEILDVHHAGTTFRFLTAFAALTGREAILTGSERMQQRPIGPLVESLRQLGCRIEYLGIEGYPPLKINGHSGLKSRRVKISAEISSQFISALLLTAPVLPEGLEIYLEGSIVSLPYIRMTLKIMEYFGVEHIWEGHVIRIAHQEYKARDFVVEPDWSSASYYYAVAALSQKAGIFLPGLKKDSVQGDAAIAEIAAAFGVRTEFTAEGVHISKTGNDKTGQWFEYNFIEQPDLVQSMAVMAAGLGTTCTYTGLSTLKIKETDRIAALQKELQRFGVHLNLMPARFSKRSGIEYYLQEGKAAKPDIPVCISTYNDHRMAMAFAPLALKFPLCIEDPDVVSKSYPEFWKDIQSLGFRLSEAEI